jgi:hypothetical protein
MQRRKCTVTTSNCKQFEHLIVLFTYLLLLSTATPAICKKIGQFRTELARQRRNEERNKQTRECTCKLWTEVSKKLCRNNVMSGVPSPRYPYNRCCPYPMPRDHSSCPVIHFTRKGGLLVHPAIILRSSCVPGKAGVKKKWHAHQK